MKSTGEKIRLIRIIKGYSQQNLSNAIGKSQNWVSKFENGHQTADNLTLIKICNFLCVDTFDIENFSQEDLNDHNEEEIILTFIRSFQTISLEIDKLVKLRNHIKNKFF